MRALPICCLITLIALSGQPPAHAGGDSEFKTVKLKEKAYKELIDCRSLTVPHEAFVSLGKPFTTAEHVFTFAVRPNGKFTVSIKPEGAEGDGKQKILGEKPGVIPIDAFGVKYALAWRPADTGDAVWVSSAYGAAIKTKSGTAYIVDSDRNGILGEIAKDGVLVPETRTVSPFASEIWTREERIVVRKVDGAWQRAVLTGPHPDDEDHSAALRLLNWRRQQCGFLSAGYIGALEKPMTLHALYCVINNHRGHDQEASKEAYNELGAAAGAQCVLAFRQPSALEAMERRLDTLYDRSQLLSPALASTAIVFKGGVLAVNVRALVGGPLKRAVLVYPPHGMENVPIGFYEKGEAPMPTLDPPTLHTLGTAVCVYAVALEDVKEMEKPTLRVSELAKGKVVKSYRRGIRYPGHPPHQQVDANNFGNVSVVPPDRLEPRTTYRGLVAFPLPKGSHVVIPMGENRAFSYTWTFTTAK